MTTNDITPDNSNRIAYGLSIIFHPYLFCIPTLIAVLSDLNSNEIMLWTSIIIGVFVLPNIFLVLYMKRKGKHTYQRGSRTPIYLLGFITLFICLFLLAVLEGPRILWMCIIALIVWIPLQLFINQLFTKVSTHMAVVSGCGVALYMLNKLNHPLLMLAMVAIILFTAWARIKTKNHSLQQVILGIMSGGGTVILVFSALL
jgi:hypothetical protein